MSFPRYPKYKDSGVEWLGQVPEHWDAKPLKHIATVDSSGCYGTEAESGQHALPVATTAQIDSGGRFVVPDMPMRGFTATEVQRYGCTPGDILVVKSSGSATNIISGKAGLVTEDTPLFVFSNFLMRIRPMPSVVLPRFVYGVLRSHLTRQRVEQMCSTTTYPNLKVSEYSSASLPLPPLAEQAVIAAFLDRETAKIDALIAEQQRLIELLQEKRQAVISHAVTKGLNPDVPMKDSGIEWLGEVPEHWDVAPLRRLDCLVQTGPFGSQLHAEEYVSGGTPVVNPTHMTGGRIIPSEDITVTDEVLARLSHQRLRKGDVVFSRRGELGRCALVAEAEEGWLCGTGSMILRLNGGEYAGEYLSLFLSLDVLRQYFESFSVGTVMDSLSAGTLLSLPVVIPPLSEQRDCVAYVRSQAQQLDGLREHAEHAITLLQERRSALISAAVTGQIDVRGLAETSEAA